MNMNEIVLFTIYAVAAADGKPGGGASKIVPSLLNMAEEDIQDKVKNFDLIVDEISKYPTEAIEAVISIADFIIIADKKIEKSEEDLINKLEKLVQSKTKNDNDMDIGEIILLIIYAVASADGKAGGGASRIIPLMLDVPEKDIQARVENFDLIIEKLKKCPQEVAEVALSIANFIMVADGKVEQSEGEIIIKLRALLK